MQTRGVQYTIRLHEPVPTKCPMALVIRKRLWVEHLMSKGGPKLYQPQGKLNTCSCTLAINSMQQCSLGVSLKGRASNEKLVGEDAHSPHICRLAIVGCSPACRGILGGAPRQTVPDAHYLHHQKFLSVTWAETIRTPMLVRSHQQSMCLSLWAAALPAGASGGDPRTRLS